MHPVSTISPLGSKSHMFTNHWPRCRHPLPVREYHANEKKREKKNKMKCKYNSRSALRMPCLHISVQQQFRAKENERKQLL